MILSRHFVMHWRERVGGEPTAARLRVIMQAAVPVQRGARYLLQNGRHYIQLGIWWHADLDIILQIDEINDTAVSLLTRHNFEQQTWRRGRKS